MQEAVGLERELPPPLGLPRPIKPASELFGEILFELGRPREAAVQFEKALARWPNRSASRLGLARAKHRGLRDASPQRRGSRLTSPLPHGGGVAVGAKGKEAR
jgi:hypothetical protein